MPAVAAPLSSVRVIECSMLGPGAITTPLADLGADVIKVEPPQGDYVREMTWPIVEGESLMHLHIHRGKRSVTLICASRMRWRCTRNSSGGPTRSWKRCDRARSSGAASATRA